MSEMMGLAGIAELPVVIANVQRVGPSTGIPTKSEQSDLFHSAFGGHGDNARVVIAPCDVEDCFDVTVKAFYIAERFQLPVIVLSDQLIGQRKETIDPSAIINDVQGFIKTNERRQPAEIEGPFMRFAENEDNVPHISVPGTPGGMFQMSGLEHDERGRPTSSYPYHEKMSRRRRHKLYRIGREFQFLRWIGPKEADVGILAWGSSKGAVKEAVRVANQNGKKVAALIPQILYPVPAEQIAEFVAAVKRLVVVELSANSQFLQLIHSAVNLPHDTISYARPGGNPLRVSEITSLIEQALDPNYEPKRTPGFPFVTGGVA
jgi:2-oxoglutarate ferredoxin oxidoreductase subunit alpha